MLLVNIKNLSFVTVRERLPHHVRKSDSLNRNNTDTSVELESPKLNETNAKISKYYNKRKRRSAGKIFKILYKYKKQTCYIIFS